MFSQFNVQTTSGFNNTYYRGQIIPDLINTSLSFLDKKNKINLK